MAYGTIPKELGVQAVLQTDPWNAFYWMLHKLQDWQTGAESAPSGGQFFSACPIFYLENVIPGRMEFEYAADWAIAWSLIDANNNGISNDLVTALFGLGDSNKPLSLADQNWPISAAGYGWYCNIANGAVTTPFDAFMNWGEGVPSYSPQILVAQLPDNGNLYNAKVLYGAPYGYVPVTFAACAAADVPPPALVTLEPDVLNFGQVPIGSFGEIQVTLTNNQQNDLQSITMNVSDSIPCIVLERPTELAAGQSAQMNVYFKPTVSGVVLSGTVTFNAQGQYDPISLTFEFAGIGVEPS